MAIIQLLDNKPLPQHLICAICNRRVTLSEAVAGLLDAEGHQRFACNGHFWSPHQLITGWADFLARDGTKGRRKQRTLEYGGEVDVRTLH